MVEKLSAWCKLPAARLRRRKMRWTMAVNLKKGVVRFIVIIGVAVAVVLVVNLLIEYL